MLKQLKLTLIYTDKYHVDSDEYRVDLYHNGELVSSEEYINNSELDELLEKYKEEGYENVGSIMEFDTEEDALIFLAAAAEIPFVDTSMCYPVSIECHMEGSRNYTGFIPVANGDDIVLQRKI